MNIVYDILMENLMDCSIDEGFIGEWIKKKQDEQRKQNEEAAKKRNETKKPVDKEQYEKDWDELENYFRKLVPILKSQSNFKEKCKASSIKYNKEMSDYDEQVKIGYIPILTVEDIGEGFMIIDEDQILTSIYSWILEDLVKLLKEKYPDIHSKWKFDYGDGDEGTIYPEYKA